MSKYTIELRFLRDYMFKFDYDYYMKGLVPDEVYEKSKKEFEDKFINHYMFDEICVDTPDRFFYMLKDYLDNAFKTYNELYKTELEVEKQHINFLLNKDLVETNKTTVESSYDNTSSSTGKSNTETEDLAQEEFNDTPRTALQNKKYATAINLNRNHSQGTSNGTSEGKNSGTTSNTATTEFTSRGNIGVTSSAELLEKWRYKYIAKFNHIKDPDYIISGTYITIPAE